MRTGNPEVLEADFRNQLQDFGLQFDTITGLPNRDQFRTSLRRMMDEAVTDGDEIALLWVDVLNVRREYSIGGEDAAERLLWTVADRLRTCVESDELICRFNDHCFLLALRRDKSTPTRLKLILETGSEAHWLSSEGRPEIAAGVAFFPEHATTSGELIRFASLAAALGTRSRSRSPIFFHPEMNRALLKERDLEKDLRIALREDRLTLSYQPQIDLVTGNVVGVEALTRWNHPTRGSVSPAQFIPVAEQSDLIDELFRNSLRRLLVDAAKWRESGVVIPSLAINASAANVRHEDFSSTVHREMDANPPGFSHLDIEVTESLMMDDENLFAQRLRALRLLGVKVSLDDFGTRYTGFNALKGLPLNSMKIDKCFVHGLERSYQSQALCRTIVSMARHLRLGTVAEGVGNCNELRILKKIGCQVGQGYLFQRPVRSDLFLEFLRNWQERKKEPEFADIFLNVEVYPQHEIDLLFGVA